MKRIVLSLAALLLLGGAASAQRYETISLKNGSLIKGEVIEQVPGKSIKVRTRDGSIFVYDISEVERITKDETSQDGHRKLDFSIEGGYYIATKSGGSGMGAASLHLGKRINSNFYLGLGAGVLLPSHGDGVVIPITADFSYYFPSSSSRITPMLSARAGYAFNSENSSGAILVELMPGLSIPLSKTTDFQLSAGYAHLIPAGGGDGAGSIAIRGAVNFHASPVKRVQKPIRDKGWQLTYELDTQKPWNLLGGKVGVSNAGLQFVWGYKFNPNISLGLGYGASYSSFTYCEDGEDTAECVMHKFFVRGRYRLNNKKCSPFASLDLGLRKYAFDKDYWHWELEDIDIPKNGLYLSPALGLSARTASNTTLDMSVGYTLTGGTKRQTRSSGWDVISSSNWGGIFFNIGFTHTFGKTSKVLDKSFNKIVAY